ncbi:MAG: DUF2169 domain-containing protein [Pasteurella sp.]|nr:DUF2169 domain-containing protein [Pasteurella sp.]
MRLQNFSKLQASYTMGLQKDGRECIVIVAKGSWTIPQNSKEEPRLITDNPLEIIEADEYLGEPGLSPLKYENDFARFKKKCDVIMHSCAYAGTELEAKYVDVNLSIDDKLNKSIRVHGPRYWESYLGLISIGESEYFEKQPIHYGIAYGGVDSAREDKGKTATYLKNPVGIGYLPNTPRKNIVGQPAPQLESLKTRINGTVGNYPALSFGPIAKNYPERLKYAGTYDDYWSKNIRPLLPDDFDERFYQCAPNDQQMPYIKGGETISLTNLTHKSNLNFIIPKQKLFMSYMVTSTEEIEIEAFADTLIIEPEENRFSIVWRGNIPIKNSIHEIDDVIVGEPTKAYYRAKLMNKTFMVNKGKRVW